MCIFSPSLHPTPASPTSLPHLYPPPWFCPCVLYSSSYRPHSPLSPPHSPLAIVTLFLISMSLVICWKLLFKQESRLRLKEVQTSKEWDLRRNERSNLPVTPPWSVRNVLPFGMASWPPPSISFCGFNDGFRGKNEAKGHDPGPREVCLIGQSSFLPQS